MRAAVAQSVEHILGKDEVMGSIPISSSILKFRVFPPRSPRGDGGVDGGVDEKLAKRRTSPRIAGGSCGRGMIRRPVQSGRTRCSAEKGDHF